LLAIADIFGELVKDGVEVLGQSQLMGSPALPQWGVPIDQFPGVSLLSWETGYGNAKYWSLMLLLQHFVSSQAIRWPSRVMVSSGIHCRLHACFKRTRINKGQF
jgi:hypothetical protein